MSRKSVVIVPGFWGDPSGFDLVIDDLQKRGYTALAVSLPSWGCEPPNKTLLDDAQAVRKVVAERVEAGHDVTVVMHSAGGFIAPEALHGLLAPDLKQIDKPGGVSGLVYITAPCMSVGDVAPPAPWFEYKDDYLWPKNPRQTLYSDLPDGEADTWAKRIKHHPANDYNSPTSQEPWKYVPSVYLKCVNDQTIPIQLQTVFSEKIPGCDVKVCGSGHSPFLSQPSEVVEAIVAAVEKPVIERL